MTLAEYYDTTPDQLAAIVESINLREQRKMRWSSWCLANLCTLIANVSRDSKAKPVRFSVDDFMPDAAKSAPRQPQSTETLKFLAGALAAAGWGKITQGGDN